jgi:hypothetical protein
VVLSVSGSRTGWASADLAQEFKRIGCRLCWLCMKGFPERWIIILRAVYPWRNFPHSHLVGRVGEQERFQISVGLYSVTLTEYFPFSEATPHSACCALRKGRRDIVWASSKLRRSTSVIATSFCLWSLCGGNKAGLNYLIISELSEAEMEKLEGLLRERANSSGRGRMCGSVE